MQWFRWYHGTCTNPKMGSIARRAGATRERVIAVWAMVLESASKSDERGRYTVDAEGIADCLNCDTESIDAILAAMHERDMLADGAVLKWEEWQKPTDASAERVRRHRAKKADVTGVTVTVTAPEREEERDVETETTSSILKLHAGEALEVEGQMDLIVRAANRGMMDNPAIGSRAIPIPTSHGSREAVREWLDAAPFDLVQRAVYERAKEYKPDGRRRQITTMAYFTGAVHDAADRWKASQTEVSDGEHSGRTGRSGGVATPMGGEKAKRRDRFAHITENAADSAA